MSDEQMTNGGGSGNGNGSESRLDRIEDLLEKFVTLSLRNEFNLAQYRKASDERMSNIEVLQAETKASQARTQAMLENLTRVVGGIGDNTIALEKFRDRVAEAAKVRPGDYGDNP